MNMRQIYDAHAHLGTEEERQVREKQGIITLFSVSDGEEAKQAFVIENQKKGYVSFGIHPWNAEKIRFEDVKNELEQATIIGEIGLDSVWCDVPLEVQEQVFIRQLKFAVSKKKPVVLHTKGQEKNIAEMIKDYPNRYLVHWYSDENSDGFYDYLAMGCYFTVGPDGEKNPAVRKVVREVPLNRLMVETDGWPAVCWALGEMPLEKMREVLENNISFIAKEKGIDEEIVEKQLERNFKEFTGKKFKGAD